MKLKIRLTTFAIPDEDLKNRFLSRYNNGKIIWENLEFVSNETYDLLIIFTYPHIDALLKGYNVDKAMTFMTEGSLSC